MIKRDSRRRKWHTPAALAGVFLFLLFFTQGTAFAWPWSQNAGSAETVAFLQNHSRWLTQASVLSLMLHGLGWLIVQGLHTLSSFLEGLLIGSLDLLGWLDMSAMDGLIGGIVRGLVVALMTLTLVWIGFKVVVSKSQIQIKSVVVNILISALLIVGMPTLLGTLTDLTLSFVGDTMSAGEDVDASLSWHIVRDNTADLVYVAHHGFELIANDNAGATRNALTPAQLGAIDLTSILTPRDVDRIDSAVPGIEHLRYHLVDDGLGNFQAVRFGGGGLLGSVLPDNGYFRYPMNFWTIFFGLLGLIVAQLFALFTFITAVIEIGFKRVVGLFVFATDLETGQRTKLVVQDILNAFLLIAFTFLSFRLYGLFLAFLGGATQNPLIYVVGIIAATFVLIKGSGTIMRYFGVDVGVKDGFAEMVGAYVVGRAIVGGARGISRAFTGGRNSRAPATPNPAGERSQDSGANNGPKAESGNAESPNHPVNHQNAGRSIEAAAQRVSVPDASLGAQGNEQAAESPPAGAWHRELEPGELQAMKREGRTMEDYRPKREGSGVTAEAKPDEREAGRIAEVPQGDHQRDESTLRDRGNAEGAAERTATPGRGDAPLSRDMSMRGRTERPISGQGPDRPVEEIPLHNRAAGEQATIPVADHEQRDYAPLPPLNNQNSDNIPPNIAAPRNYPAPPALNNPGRERSVEILSGVEHVGGSAPSSLPTSRYVESEVISSAPGYGASRMIGEPLPARREAVQSAPPPPHSRAAGTKPTSKQVMRAQLGSPRRGPELSEKESLPWRQKDAEIGDTPWWRLRDTDEGGEE